MLEDASAIAANDDDHDDDFDETELLRCLAETDDVEERVEILAVMSKRGFRVPTRGQGGPRKPAVPRFGNTAAARFGNTAAAPPRGRDDMKFFNCGRKGHGTDECRQPKVDVKDRPCFECGEKGHISRNCPKKRKPVKAIEDAPAKRAAVLCVQVAPPRRQDPNFGRLHRDQGHCRWAEE